MSEFLIFDDCKSISKVPITPSACAILKIRYIDSKICAFESVKERDPRLTKSVYYVLHTNPELYDGLRDIPHHAKFYSGMVLKDCKVYSSFVASEENHDTLMIDGKVTIITDNPIVAYDHVKISGVPGSKLTLIGMRHDQPCIGTVTNTGLSYGRYMYNTLLSSDGTTTGYSKVTTGVNKNAVIIKSAPGTSDTATNGSAIWQLSGEAGYRGYISANANGTYYTSFETSGITKVGNAQYVLDSARFQANLVKSPDGTIIGIVFEQLE